MRGDKALDIEGALRGRRIFITGGTGFLGKVLVEKLLWSVPDVGRLVLLVRPEADRGAEERLRDEVLAAPPMARLRALHGDTWEAWAAGRVEVVAGDLARDRFGLSVRAWEGLAERVDRVVHCAATVAFDERLDRALELNTRGALRALELARAAGAPLLHVSTCFVSGRRSGPVTERVHDGWPGLGDDVALDATLTELDALCRFESKARDGAGLVEAGAAAAARRGFHDVYTLTKALAERLIARRRADVPVAIVRPAIVESALAEPIPGWIDAVRVADPLLAAYGRGDARALPGSATARLDLVPVDQVVNVLVAALADLGGGTGLRVYQVSSSRNPVTLGEILEHARAGFERAPLRDSAGLPIRPRPARFVDPERYRRRLARRRRAVGWMARRLGTTSAGRRLAVGERTLDHYLRVVDVYRPYLAHGARYDDTATRELWERLSPADRTAFPFDPTVIDWRAYLSGVHVPGLVRFALRAESGAPPAARADDPVAATHARGEYPAVRATHLYELLALAAARDPEALAFQTCREGRWLRYTYGQALATTANVAASLERHGVGRGDRVALWGSAGPEWVLTWFAALRLGAVPVPLDPQWPPEEVLAAAAFTDARLICAAPSLGRGLRGADLPVVHLAAPFVPEPDVPVLPGAEKPPAALQPDDLASIHFTSGTTVEPKAVPLTHGNLLANVRDLVPIMRLSRERLLSVLPIHHVFELTVGLLVPLAGNSSISYVAELKPAEIRWTMGETRPTMLVAVPRLLELLHAGIRQSIESGGPLLRALFALLGALSAATGGRFGPRLFGKVHQRFGGHLRRIATGGSALDPELGRSFHRMGFRVAEGYGMTETSPVLTVNPWDAVRFGSAGRPLPGVEIDVRPDAACGPGEGSIWVRGANVMGGYWRDPEATRAALRDGWLDTGDVGSFDADGYLHIAGRTKEVIVTSAGKNVYPEEVERRYRGIEGVQDLVVLGLPGGGGGERVCAVVVPGPEATEVEVEAIREAIEARSAAVPSYQQIARVEIWRGELPKTTTMKVRRTRLREALLRGESLTAATAIAPGVSPPEPAAPRSEGRAWVEATLARLVRIRPDSLRASDRLVELGLDSLARVELLAELEGRFGLRLDDDSAATLRRVGDVLALVEGERVAAG